MLRVENLHIRLGDFRLHNLSFTVEKGDYFVLLGASGVGKTLLIEALAGLVPVRSGRVRWEDEDLLRTPIQQRGMGLVYQDQALFPHMTVRRNIAYGARAAHASHAAREDLVEALAAQVGVTDLLDRYPGTLSGGEMQRVALARALATTPRCLLLDEPLSALDNPARNAMRGLLRKLHRNGQTVVHVTHDYEEALALGTHVGILEAGTITQTGMPAEVFQHPTSEFVARFIGIRNVFPGVLEAHGNGDKDMAIFICKDIRFHVLTESPPCAGLMIVRSEDVALFEDRPDSSVRNCFQGVITDIAPARLGVEVYVDIGVEVAALITSNSVARLDLRLGRKVWLGFKASAARFLEE